MAEVALGRDTNSFTIEYQFVPALDAHERLDQAYGLIVDLLLPLLQNPEEDAAGAFPDAADAGGKLQLGQVVKSSLQGTSHVG